MRDYIYNTLTGTQGAVQWFMSGSMGPRPVVIMVKSLFSLTFQTTTRVDFQPWLIFGHRGYH